MGRHRIVEDVTLALSFTLVAHVVSFAFAFVVGFRVVVHWLLRRRWIKRRVLRLILGLPRVLGRILRVLWFLLVERGVLGRILWLVVRLLWWILRLVAGRLWSRTIVWVLMTIWVRVHGCTVLLAALAVVIHMVTLHLFRFYSSFSLFLGSHERD